MPNTDTVIGWASGIDRLFGRLGDVKESEIVEHHNLGLRSVSLYYQGRKRPAKIWVTFSGTTIAGFHYNLWEEGVAKREPTFLIKLAEHPLTWWFGSILGIVAIIFLFCYGAYRHNYDWGKVVIHKIYLYSDESFGTLQSELYAPLCRTAGGEGEVKQQRVRYSHPG